MTRTIHWAGHALEVTTIAGVGIALRSADPSASRLMLPLLGRAVWELCCHDPVGVAGVDEVSASDVEMLVQTRREDVDALLADVARCLPPTQPHRPRTFRLPVCFEIGTDWEFVEQHTGLGRETAIEGLLAGTYTLGMFGFLPGFAYLLGLDPALRCPRKSTPDPRIAAGTVALGGDYLGVYGVASPAGWRSVGRTPFSLGSLRTFPPLVMDVGDAVTLTRIDHSTFDAWRGRELRAEETRS